MEDKVLEIVVDITGEPEISEERDLDLFENGLIDSLGIVSLIVRLEEAFDIVIAPSELEREDFNTVNKITAVVKEKVGQ